MHTIKTRKKIGFPERRHDWVHAPAIYDDHTLRIAGHPVMEDWELGYMHLLAEIATSNQGQVLEIGYGLGLSAKAIQSHTIKSHFVIECHPDVITRCIKDLYQPMNENRLHVMSGFWQDITPCLRAKSFDGILFDTYPMSEEEIHANHFWFFEEAYRLLKPGGVLTYYSDEATGFSDLHLKKLQCAGFLKRNIQHVICDVAPPVNCEYWQAKTILAPIIRKT